MASTTTTPDDLRARKAVLAADWTDAATEKDRRRIEKELRDLEAELAAIEDRERWTRDAEPEHRRRAAERAREEKAAKKAANTAMLAAEVGDNDYVVVRPLKLLDRDYHRGDTIRPPAALAAKLERTGFVHPVPKSGMHAPLFALHRVRVGGIVYRRGDRLPDDLPHGVKGRLLQLEYAQTRDRVVDVEVLADEPTDQEPAEAATQE